MLDFDPGGGALEVELLLTSQPLRSYKGRLRRQGLGGEATLKDGGNVIDAAPLSHQCDAASRL